jgi:hypothetical protein
MAGTQYSVVNYEDNKRHAASDEIWTAETSKAESQQPLKTL